MRDRIDSFLRKVFTDTGVHKEKEKRIFETYVSLNRNTLMEWATKMGIRNRYAMRKQDMVRYAIIDYRIQQHTKEEVEEYALELGVYRPYHRNKDDIVKDLMKMDIDVLEHHIPGVRAQKILDDLSREVFHKITLKSLKAWARLEGFKGYSVMNHDELSRLVVIEYRLKKLQLGELRDMAHHLGVPKVYRLNKKNCINAILKQYIKHNK